MTNERYPIYRWRPRAHGVSLVIVMMFLVILSVLGVVSMQGSTFASRIARNEADRSLAFQAAEAALRDAENDIRGLKSDGVTQCVGGAAGCRAELIQGGIGFNTTCPTGLCTPNASAPVWETASMWSTSGASIEYGTYTGAAALPVVVRKPRYLIEVFNPGGFGYVYRVTAVGFGASESTQVMLQTAVRGPI